MHWTDEAQACAAIASAFISLLSAFLIVPSLWQATDSLRAQNKSNDISIVLTAWERLDAHWQRFRLADGINQEFEFGQLIGYYEMACGFYKNKVVQTHASIILFEHLRDILPIMRENTEFEALFARLSTHPENFENINWFCKKFDRPAA